MSIEGTINSLYLDYEQTKPLFPRTKTKAISDDNGVGLDALLDEMNHNFSNKAPAGFGYGEAKYLIWWDDSDGTKLENALDSFFTDINMRDKIYRFTVVDYPACAIAGQGGYADIVCTDFTGNAPQSITIVYYAVDGYNTGMAIATKKKHSGVWQPWEYLNPPMQPGIEYRTTERWNGAPVYTAMLDMGTAPNSTAKSLAHPPEIKPTRVIGWSGDMVNTDAVSVALPNQSGIMEVQVDNYGTSLFTKDDRSNFHVYLKIKYIK